MRRGVLLGEVEVVLVAVTVGVSVARPRSLTGAIRHPPT